MAEFILETNYPSRRIIPLRRMIRLKYKFGHSCNRVRFGGGAVVVKSSEVDGGAISTASSLLLFLGHGSAAKSLSRTHIIPPATQARGNHRRVPLAPSLTLSLSYFEKIAHMSVV